MIEWDSGDEVNYEGPSYVFTSYFWVTPHPAILRELIYVFILTLEWIFLFFIMLMRLVSAATGWIIMFYLVHPEEVEDDIEGEQNVSYNFYIIKHRISGHSEAEVVGRSETGVNNDSLHEHIKGRQKTAFRVQQKVLLRAGLSPDQSTCGQVFLLILLFTL